MSIDEDFSKRTEVVFSNCPMPPSSNHQYASKVIKGRVLHFKTKEVRDWKSEFDTWCLQNMAGIKFAREFVKDKTLGVGCLFFFEQARLYTKTGKLKKLDVSNRIKALHDALAEALHIDDSVFMKIWAEKAMIMSGRDSVTIRIQVL